MKFNLTHARHDPSCCLTPGLFRSLMRGERKKSKLDVVYIFGEDRIEFSGPEPLGADDMRVLQGLVAMVSGSGNGSGIALLNSNTGSEEGKQLRFLMELKDDAIPKDCVISKGSYRQLAREIGYKTDSGSSFKTIQKSIERLWKVSVIVQRKGRRQGFHILSQYRSDEDSGELFVALNPRITDAVVGDKAHTRIELSEIRALKTDPARLMHQRLCGWIDPGKSGRVGIDTLCSYVWHEDLYKPKDVQKEKNTQRIRRMRIRKSLNELCTIGWTFSEYVKGKFNINRPET